MTTYLGVDHSLAATGVCAIHVCAGRQCLRHVTGYWPAGSVRVFARTIHTRPSNGATHPHGWSQAERHHRIVTEVRAMAERGDTVAAIEDRPPIRDAADPVMAGVRAIVCYGLFAARVPLAAVHLAKVKAYACGSGAAPKGEVLAEARCAARGLDEHCPIEDDNQADAFWLAAMAMHHYEGRLDIGGYTAKRLSTLNGITWPVFTPAIYSNR